MTQKQPSVYGSTDLSYNSYLKVPELLALQHPLSEPAHHDELLFIVIHQAYELWFKQILHEVEAARACMGEGRVLQAHHYLKRVAEIFRVLVQQIHILETMRPADFLEFRDRLNPASGFQSLQFRELEFLVGVKEERYLTHFQHRPEMLTALRRRLAETDLRQEYYALLGRLGFEIPPETYRLETKLQPGLPSKSHESSASDDAELARVRDGIMRVLLPIYREPEKNHPLYLLTESLVDLDQYLALWRDHHVRVVERVIGFKPGTGGSSGVGYLRMTTAKKAFPFLWEARGYLER